ncbi:MAG TPA: hypothetical protein VKK79_21100, partial [Candidatus Lokiarchaeia archaeon]|nr:hypothetical protein [Candidatus Lokiarchaeia archaeon]
MSKKTVALIGYGNIGHSWEPAIRQHPDWELVAIVDSNTELLENVPNMGIGISGDQTFTSITE